MLQPKDAFEYLPMVYDAAGLSQYADMITPDLIEFLYMNDWIGRDVLELGCGTGASLAHFVEQKLHVDAIDTSVEMLKLARTRVGPEDVGITVNLSRTDMRQLKPKQNAYDLVFSLDAMNYITSARDFENIIRRSNYALKMGKVLLFDMQTISGLAKEATRYPTHIIHNSPTDFLLSEARFDFDTSSLELAYYIFSTEMDGGMARHEELHLLRGYPLRALESMLERSGFTVRAIINTNLERIVDVLADEERILIVAEKIRDFSE